MKKEELVARLNTSETNDNLVINVKSYKRISKDKNNIDEAS